MRPLPPVNVPVIGGIFIFILLSAAGAMVSRPAFAAPSCWTGEQPATLEELGHLLENRNHRDARQAQARMDEPALLALSDGAARLGYVAGLLTGWSQTGFRPNFTTVTAVGASALIAPFVFAGEGADRGFTELFMCGREREWSSFAKRARELIDKPLLDTIANRHRHGARLLVALPGSPSRRETIWDLGAIADSRRDDVRDVFLEVMLAAVDPTYRPRFNLGREVKRTFVFRTIGAGEPFLWPRDTTVTFASITLVHAGVMFPDETAAFEATLRDQNIDAGTWLFPALAISAESEVLSARFRFASVKPMLNLTRSGEALDLPYERDLFRHAFRQGRMNKEWRATLPSLSR